MIKADIAEKICRKLDVSRAEALEHIEHLLEIIKSTLESGENVKISGFGNFEVKEKSERRCRHPLNGEDITIEARKILFFKASVLLRQSINSQS